MRQYGWDAKLTDLLPALMADCAKRRSVSVYDGARRCSSGGVIGSFEGEQAA